MRSADVDPSTSDLVHIKFAIVLGQGECGQVGPVTGSITLVISPGELSTMIIGRDGDTSCTAA